MSLRLAAGLALFFGALVAAMILAFPSVEVLGRYHEVDGRLDEARAAYERIAAAEPQNSRIRARLAHLCLARGEVAQAIRRLSELARLHPRSRSSGESWPSSTEAPMTCARW